MSRVDVIVPCYNYARFLPECVGSVLGQGVPLRVLIIDDCSQDETPEVSARLAESDARVTVRRHAENRGHLTTYDEGYAWAEADYTLLLSADDLLTPGALSRAITLMDSHPDTAFAYGRVVRFRSGDPLPAAHAEEKPDLPEVLDGPRWIERICRDPSDSITSPEAVIRTSHLKKLGGMRHDLPHTGDQEMWLRYAAHGSVGILNADQAYYRQHAHSMQATSYGTALADLQHWRAAFHAFFNTQGNLLPDAKRLRALSDEGLAREALWAAYAALYSGASSPAPELLDFACEAFPPARWWRIAWQVRAINRLGPERWHQFRRLVGRGASTPARTSGRAEVAP